MARHRSSARPVIFEYFTPGIGLELERRDHRAGVNLGDAALDGELAAFLLEQPGAVHELAFIDLALGLGPASSSARGGSVYSPFRRFGRRPWSKVSRSSGKRHRGKA